MWHGFQKITPSTSQVCTRVSCQQTLPVLVRTGGIFRTKRTEVKYAKQNISLKGNIVQFSKNLKLAHIAAFSVANFFVLEHSSCAAHHLNTLCSEGINSGL